MSHRCRFILAFSLTHGAASAALLFGGWAAAARRLSAGEGPSQAELLAGTVSGLFLAPVFNILARFPRAAGLFSGFWSCLPIAANSVLWAWALSWLGGSNGRKS